MSSAKIEQIFFRYLRLLLSHMWAQLTLKRNGMNFEWIPIHCAAEIMFSTRNITHSWHTIQYLVIGVKMPSSTAPTKTRAQCVPKCVEIDMVSVDSMFKQFKMFLSPISSCSFSLCFCVCLLAFNGRSHYSNSKELKVSKKRSLITHKSINFIYLGSDIVDIVIVHFELGALRCSIQSFIAHSTHSQPNYIALLALFAVFPLARRPNF